MTGQKLDRLCGESRHRSTRTQRNTSLWTIGAETFRRVSTSFSCMLGSCVRKWFFSADKMTYDNRLRLSERNSISYSLFVKIFADATVVILPTRYHQYQQKTS